MSFFAQPTRKRLVPGVGRESAKIVIVGEYTDGHQDKALDPYSGPTGTVLESCLHAADLIKGDIYFTNLFKSRTAQTSYKLANTDFFRDNGKNSKFTDKGLEHVQMLREELEKLNPNIIVAAGRAPLMALTNLWALSSVRGYVTQATALRAAPKLIPTFSPASTIRGSYVNRHVIVCDLRKAKQQSGSPELVRPARKLVYDYSSIEELLQWGEWLCQQSELSVDIEVINYEIACISFSPNPDIGIVFPIGNTVFRPQGWSEEEEFYVWKMIQRIVGNEKIEKVFQNGLFDIHFMLTRAGIVVRGVVRDTMIGHSCMFPELPKGLEFLGSIYCGAQEHWKDLADFENIKGES